MGNMVLKFHFPGCGSSEPLLKIVNFLLQFHDLSFFLVKDSGVIEGPGASALIMVGVWNGSSKKTFNFGLEEDESFVELIFFLAGKDDLATTTRKLRLESK